MKFAILAALLAACATAGGDAWASPPASVDIVVHAEDAKHAAPFTLTFKPADASSTANEIVKEISSLDGAPISIALPNGAWSVDAIGETVWHARQYVIVPASRPFVLEIYRRAEVTGTIKAGTETPGEVTLRLSQPVPWADAAEHVITCPVRDARFICAVPAGEFDIVAQSPGFIAHAFPGFQVTAEHAADLGEMKLVRGQSILARVIAPKGVDAKGITATAIPSGAANSKRTPVGTSRGRGWIQFDGVAPGQYDITARHPLGLASATTSVTVNAGRDAVLARPLVLTRPAHVNVQIDPPLSADGQRWSIEIAKMIDSHEIQTVSMSNASAHGFWQSPALPPRDYVIAVSDAKRTVFRRTVTLTDAELDLHVPVSERTIRGTVKLGETPLEAEVEFGTADGISATAQSNAEGQFELALPDPDAKEWKVFITADTPEIRRQFSVELSAEQRNVDLVLPSIDLTGIVVDEKNQPVPHAIVTVAGDDYLEQADSDEDGVFVLSGLAPGEYRAQASAIRLSSAATDFEISADAHDVKLVLLPDQLLRGRVMSAYGPVPGARIKARATNVPMAMLHEWRADDQGRFTAILPPNTTEMDIEVSAPGFAYASGHVQFAKEELEIQLTQDGGTLFVPNVPEGKRARLFHDGSEIMFDSITDWPVTRVESGREMANFEPGAYRFCVQSDCATGFLPPGGELRLSPP